MLVVLFIISIILAIALPNLFTASEKAKARADLANCRLIGAQAEAFYLDLGRYPTAVEELYHSGYLQRVPKCATLKKRFIIKQDPKLKEEERVVCA
ncbi:MAG: hypothetical protein RLZ12_306 [Bacillota bacterium]|jgi:competence protein ComGC